LCLFGLKEKNYVKSTATKYTNEPQKKWVIFLKIETKRAKSLKMGHFFPGGYFGKTQAPSFSCNFYRQEAKRTEYAGKN